MTISNGDYISNLEIAFTQYGIKFIIVYTSVQGLTPAVYVDKRNLSVFS